MVSAGWKRFQDCKKLPKPRLVKYKSQDSYQKMMAAGSQHHKSMIRNDNSLRQKIRNPRVFRQKSLEKWRPQVLVITNF
mgnify:CR=1 FL=1